MWHRAGTITITKGNKAVTGVGTAWVQNIRAGDGLQGPDGRLYEITNVSSDTALAIEPAYMGATASGQAYWIIPVHGYLKKLADEAAGLVRSVGLLPGEVESNERRIANAEQAMLTKTGNLAGLGDKAKARENLGLGGAATKNVGPGAGQVLSVDDAFGLGVNNARAGVTYRHLLDLNNGFSTIFANQDDLYAAVINFNYSGLDRHILLAKNFGSNRLVWVNATRYGQANEQIRYITLYTTENTTVDSNGFIKRASPIIKLYSDKVVKTDHLEIKGAALERVDVGHYVVRNAPLLSRDGWYIETPKDRNGNIYFTLDYEEADGVLTIRTYTPDYSTGPATNGEPVDILDGRFVSLRFTEDPSLYPKPEIPEQDVPAA